ncbi:MAG TPA: hypothetical protein VJS44_23120 [Pyrinomonadaceae bacterium]|nr:hypothetical protein [Pyrinomonadaceae bacterium]
MESRTQTQTSTQQELVRRHRLAATVTRAFLVLTVALIAVAFTGRAPTVGSGNPDPVLVAFIRIGIVVMGIGAVTLRRTRFAAMRLQDVAAVRGISGMLATLQNTTVQVAALGGFISILGFFLMMLTVDPSNMVFIGIAALAVLIYAYPRRAAWQRVLHGIQQSGDANDTPAKGRVA